MITEPKAAAYEQEINMEALELIAGLDAQLESLTDIIKIRLDRDVVETYDLRPARGALLFGPHGCGKRLLVNAALARVSTDMDLQPVLLHVPLPRFLSLWRGEYARRMREFFNGARRGVEEGHLVVIVLDELEMLCRAWRGRRMNAGATRDDEMVRNVCAELDGMGALNTVFWFGLCTDLRAVHPRLTVSGRLELLVEVPRPDATAAGEIFVNHLRDAPVRLNGNVQRGREVAKRLVDQVLPDLFDPDSDLSAVVHVMQRDGRQVTYAAPDLLSGAQIADWVSQAKRTACMRDVEARKTVPTGVTVNDLRNSISRGLDGLAAVISPSNLFEYLGDFDPEARIDTVSVTSARPGVQAE